MYAAIDYVFSIVCDGSGIFINTTMLLITVKCLSGLIIQLVFSDCRPTEDWDA